MIGLQLKLKRQSVFGGMRGMREQARQVGKVLSRLRPILKRDLQEHAERERSPAGSWPRRAVVSERRAGKRSARVIRGRTRKATKTRGARSSISFASRRPLLGSAPDTVTIKKRGRVLRAQSTVRNNKGTRIGAALQEKVKTGHGATNPARPFVFLSPAFLDKALEELAEFVFVKGWRKR